MDALINIRAVVNSLVFALIGIVIFLVGFYSFDKITPYHLWREIVEDQNVALAIIVGSVALGISMIISAAVHG